MKKIVFFFLFIQNMLLGQVLNIDRELVSDTLPKNHIFSATFGFSSDKQKNNVSFFKSNLEYDRMFKNKHVFISSFKSDLTSKAGNLIQNAGIIQVRYRDNDFRKFRPEIFLQYQWNEAWGMESRLLQGINLREKWIKKNGFDFITAVGIFREQETWSWVGVNESLVPLNAGLIKKDLFRFNTYVKSAFQISQNIDFSAISFVQFPLTNDFAKPRWLWDCNLYFNLSKHVNFQVHYDHIFDANTIVPISEYYYSVSTGLQIVM